MKHRIRINNIANTKNILSKFPNISHKETGFLTYNQSPSRIAKSSYNLWARLNIQKKNNEKENRHFPTLKPISDVKSAIIKKKRNTLANIVSHDLEQLSVRPNRCLTIKSNEHPKQANISTFIERCRKLREKSIRVMEYNDD